MTEELNEPKPAPDYMAYAFIALRAYYYWEKRGSPFGSPASDWYEAIKDIRSEMIRASGSWT